MPRGRPAGVRNYDRPQDPVLWVCLSCQWKNQLNQHKCQNCNRKKGAPLENVSFIYRDARNPFSFDRLMRFVKYVKAKRAMGHNVPNLHGGAMTHRDGTPW